MTQSSRNGRFTRRKWFGCAGAIGAGLTLRLTSSARAAETSPVTGLADASLEPLDRMLRSFVREQQVPGAALAVSRHGKLVYARGFGYANVEQQTPVAPDALFRIASVSKPVTAVAVLQLAERGKLKLDSPVLDQIVSPPEKSEAKHLDPRWRKVTIRHCLQHTGGWDREASFDPIAQPRRIVKEGAPSPQVIIGYMLRRPLDFEPGQRYAYSNFGYLLLGSAIQRATFQEYETYIRRHVFQPLGVARARLGRPLLADRFEREVRYYDARSRLGPSLYAPNRGQSVPLPYGAENFAAFQAHGGWIASAVDLVRFASALDD
ncbi:MAG: serine hydrolase domain-containing protein, partial [Pirellulales bacterium]